MHTDKTLSFVHYWMDIVWPFTKHDIYYVYRMSKCYSICTVITIWIIMTELAAVIRNRPPHSPTLLLNKYDILCLQDVQMLLNMYCNNHMNHNDGTCCCNPEQTTTLPLPYNWTNMVYYVYRMSKCYSICIVITTWLIVTELAAVIRNRPPHSPTL